MCDNWTLYKTLKAIVSANLGDAVNGRDLHGSVLLSEIAALGKIQCEECDGFGHSANKCPTYDKIQAVTKGVPAFRTYVNRAREAKRHSNIKVVLGKRRTLVK